MCRVLLSTAVLAVCLGAARGQDNQAKVDQLKKEIADLRAKLGAREVELAAILPAKEVRYLRPYTMEIGEAGPLVQTLTLGGRTTESPTYIQVERILDDRKFVAVVGVPERDVKRPTVVIGSYPTAGLAEGKTIDPPHFRVVGTEKVGDRVLYLLEPYTRPKK